MFRRDGVGGKPWVDGRDSAASDFYTGEFNCHVLFLTIKRLTDAISKIHMVTDMGIRQFQRHDHQERQDVARR